MLDKLQALEEKFMELEAGLSDPAIISDQATFQKYAKAHSAMAEVVSVFREYKRAKGELDDARELLESSDTDAEMKDLAQMEFESLNEIVPELEQRLTVLLLPKDPNDEKNVIVEIRGGTGGDEAALFAGNLFRMYARYAEKHNWKIEIMSTNETELGGFKEIIFAVEGYGAYSRLKFESGVHRVQRVPETEAGGRIHTSAATVAVLPEAEDVDIDLNPNELRIDVYRSQGPGGQSVNTTDSAVRITHVPTGIVVACQDEKSQHKNKDKAMKILRARLLDAAIEKQKSEMDQARKSQVGSGDRSERIRTYNFPQNRCTDHRIGMTLHKLTLIMDGDLDEIIDALVTTEQSERLKNVE